MSTSPPTRSPPERIGPLRSRRGCKVCKTRKVKCGEEKPSCCRCITSRYKCEYDSPTTYSYASGPSTNSLLDLPVSSFPNTVWRERRAFAYYFQHAAPYLAGGLDQHFWGSVVPQMCRTEPAVWDAVNAISTLFESPEICLDFVFLSLRHEKSRFLNQEQSEALGWYLRSLSKIRTQIERGKVDAAVALISCVLFMCIESLQGHVEEALQLYGQGTKLILDLRAMRCSPAQATLREDTLVPLFIRLGTAALTISGVPVSDLLSELEFEGEYKFASLESARDSLVSLAAQVLVLQKETGDNPFIGLEAQITPKLWAKQIYLRERLNHWYRAYAALSQSIQTRSSSLETRSGIAALLLAFHTTLAVIVATCLSRSGSVFDAHLPDFRTIVEQAGLSLEASGSPDGTQPAFTFELGVGLPLYFTALECREPGLRRKALELLRKAPPMQGFHKTAPGLAIAAKVMQLEEEFSKNMHVENASEAQNPGKYHLPTPPHDDKEEGRPNPMRIPEEARVRHYCVFRPRDQPFLLGPHDVRKWNRSPDQLYIRFTRNRRDPVNETLWHLTDECVPMD
ncbi:Zn(II)2Cys6 transcription factor domain-containing protein [Aspergillus lucknowensis]|uniref:Zn(2)-C6 fungal-type domain-containing protein n=1 Tax=Aspergillus lucknowensis TaxID=176173 RepID=A0ABR4M2U3_9EURO